jgi:hypothetical protein
MNTISRRIAAGFALAAAPVVIALGAAGVSQAQTTADTYTGPVGTQISSTHQSNQSATGVTSLRYHDGYHSPYHR